MSVRCPLLSYTTPSLVPLLVVEIQTAKKLSAGSHLDVHGTNLITKNHFFSMKNNPMDLEILQHIIPIIKYILVNFCCPTYLFTGVTQNLLLFFQPLETLLRGLSMPSGRENVTSTSIFIYLRTHKAVTVRSCKIPTAQYRFVQTSFPLSPLHLFFVYILSYKCLCTSVLYECIVEEFRIN
jgi:hypothetical protein